VYVDKYSKNIPYDYCIYQTIEDYFNFDHNNRALWQFIKRNYVHNNMIVNYSTIKDMDIDIKYIINKYNPAILHQKTDKAILDIFELKNIPNEFDANFYVREYPETAEYYSNTTKLSLKHRLYHHYLAYGRYQKYFMNSTQKQLNSK
jgi:hypothetical protein